MLFGAVTFKRRCCRLDAVFQYCLDGKKADQLVAVALVLERPSLFCPFLFYASESYTTTQQQ